MLLPKTRRSTVLFCRQIRPETLQVTLWGRVFSFWFGLLNPNRNLTPPWAPETCSVSTPPSPPYRSCHVLQHKIIPIPHLLP